MKQLNKWYFAYDLTDDQQQRLGQSGNRTLGFLLILLIIALLASFVWDLFQEQYSVLTPVIAVALLTALGYGDRQLRKVTGRKYGEDSAASATEYVQKRRRLAIAAGLQAIVTGSLLGIFYFYVTGLILKDRFSWFDFFWLIGVMIVIGVISFLSGHALLRKQYAVKQ